MVLPFGLNIILLIISQTCQFHILYLKNVTHVLITYQIYGFRSSHAIFFILHIGHFSTYISYS